MSTLRWKHVRIERAGNPQWPLPANYADMDSADQLLARRNACLMRETPQQLAQSWLYFCKRYLRPDPAAGFDPMFYHPPVRDFGFIHPLIVKEVMGNDCSAIAMPRGSAKSTTLQSLILFLLCTERQSLIRYYVASESKVADSMQQIRRQLEDNPRIREDFGNLVPQRNASLWSHHEIETAETFSSLKIATIWGKRMRGGRGDLIILDDVEYDEDSPAKSDEDVDRLKLRVLKIIIPMMEEGAHLSFVGTMLHCKSLLYTIVAPDVRMPDRDPRLRDELWYKINVPAKVVHTAADGTQVTKRAWAKFSDDFLAKKREVQGAALHDSEFYGEPISSLDCPFQLIPAHHEYTLEGNLDGIYTEPFAARDAVVCYHECAGVDPLTTRPMRREWNDWLNSLYRFITVDYAYTAHAGSDWSVVHVLGADSRNDLWSLDMWRGRVRFPALVGKVWELALRWRAICLGVEAYPVQEQYYEQVAAFGEKVLSTYGYFPSLKQIKPPVDKGQRILRLQWRFERGKLKLPSHRRLTSPYFQLYQQIQGFTEDLANLPTDDEIDTLSMSTDVLQGQIRTTPSAHTATTPLELLEQGQLLDENGLPIIAGLPLNAIPGRILRELANRGRVDMRQEMQQRLNRDPSEQQMGLRQVRDPYAEEDEPIDVPWSYV